MKNLTTLIIIITTWMLTSITSIAQITTYPYVQSFEDILNEPPSQAWDNLMTGDNITCGPWEYGSETGTPNTGPNYPSEGLTFIYVDGNNCDAASTIYTTSPEFSLAGLNLPTFSFDHFRYGANVGGMDVEITTDGGGVWTSLLAMPFTVELQSAETDPWEEVSIDLSDYIDQNVMIRFAAEDRAGDNEGDIAIDNVQLYDAGIINGEGDVSYFYDEAGNRTRREYTITSMAQSEQELIASARSVEEGSEIEFLNDELFKVYPNPATDFIQVESLEANGPTTVHLLDASGRELHVAYINDASSVQIDMSSYRSGVYVMWIQMEDRVVTKKIIKH